MTRTAQSCDTPDVIVVGAGVVGLATAWALVRRGRTVLLIDPNPARGATYAAAGMLGAVAELNHTEAHLAGALAAASRRYPEFVASLPAGTGYEPAQTLLVGVGADDRRVLDELAAKALGAYESLTPRQARAAEPLLAGGAARTYSVAGDHRIDPRSLAGILLDAVRTSGRAVVQRATVRRVVRADGGVPSVQLDDGTVLGAGDVVVTCGAAVGTIEGVAGAQHVRPVYGDVLRLEAPELLRPVLSATVRARAHGRSVYLVPRPTGLVIGASQREDGRHGTSAGAVRDLLNDAVKVLPAVAEMDLLEVTTRARPGTPDNAPLVGRVEDGLVLATGTFRNGVLLAPLVADVVAALVADVRPGDADIKHALTVMDPTRFDRDTTGRAVSATYSEERS